MKAISLFFSKRVFQSRRAAIYRKMAFGLARGGTPAGEFLAMYQNAQKRKSSLVAIYQHWYETLRGSGAGHMARSMQGTIPESEYALLAIAEKNRSLVEGLEFLSISVTKVNEMRNGFVDAIKSTILPVILIVVGIIGIDAYFFPLLEDTMPRREWPIVTKLVASVAHEIGTIMSVFVLLFPILLTAWIWSLPRFTGRSRSFAERWIPLLYNKYRDFQCVMFQVSLAFLREAGVSPRMSLVRIESMASPYMKYHVGQMLAKLDKDATNFGEVIVSTGLFSPDLSELISDYARWADWHSQMRGIADSSMEIVTHDVKKLGPMLQTLLQLSIGLIIFIVMAAAASAMVKVMMQTTAR